MRTASIAFDEPPLAADEKPTPLVVFLDRVEAEDASRAGGKGANLGRMLQAGLPVPRGFCVTTEAFRQQIASQAEIERLWAALAQLQSGPIDALLAAGTRVREQLAAAPLLPPIEQAVVTAWEKQGPTRAYAVRSSATIEDGAHASFAGQGETFLNVRGRQAIFDAIRACWASLFAERAILYRKRQGIDPRAAAMAVVVQEMICADVSGVLFTADPLSGDTRTMVIEGVYGLGQSLVSGEANPDRIVLARPGLQTLEYRLGDKAVEVVPKKTTGPRRRPVDAERRESACLDEATLRQLGKLALQAERALGGPQDVEWAVSGAEVFLLQSRPITSTNHKTEEPRTVWSNMNSWEVLPGVVAPMSWSLVSLHFKCMFRPMLRVLGIDIERQPLFGLIAGRAYANVGTFAAIARAVPLPDRLDFVQGLGGRHSKRLAEQLARHEARGWAAGARNAARLLRFAVWSVAHAVDQRSKRDLDTFRRHLNQLASAEVGVMSESELVSHVAAALRCNGRYGPELAADVAVAVTFVHLFFAFIKKRLGHEGDAIANRLLEGLGGLASAEAGMELWELADWARRRPGLASALAQAGDFAALGRRLARTADEQEFLARWQRFMARHGHHACGEFDARTPRWSETPDDVLDMLRSHLRSLADTDPGDFRRRAAQRRAALAGECRRRLGNPLSALSFDYLLRKARFGLTLRENARNEVVRMLAIARRTLLELGQRLAARGALAHRDDIFYLELPELPNLVAGVGMAATIATRKAEFAYNQTITPPPVVVGQFKPEEFIREALPRTTPTFHGLPASAGVATGPARVILRPQADQRVEPGEILVAPFTDPGWTPYFLAAAGIVMDVGGMLSHGSIVAREYGIPTVVNVGPATQVIRTGQVVRVDGDRGVVTVLS